jgi:transcriptional regulator with XRE-family HTH domain
MIGERIRFIRNELDMSQEQLADLLHVDQSSLSRYERNISTPSLEVMLTLSDIIGIDLRHLFMG